MPDLDDIAVFHAVAARGSFTAAATSLSLPKATVSKRISRLEAKLGVRLLQRSTRRLRLTDVGEAVFSHAEVVVDGLEAALAAARSARTEPSGTICMSCPQGLLADLVEPMLRRFLHAYPKVTLEVRQLNRPVDLIAEGVDLALRVRTVLTEEGALVIRRLGVSRRMLVASPELVFASGGVAAAIDFAEVPLLTVLEHEHEWLALQQRGSRTALFKPRLKCENLSVLRDAAIAGLGFALLPEHLCRAGLAVGSLVQVHPDPPLPSGIIHLAFSSRRGLPTAIRSLIDHLTAEFARHTMGSESKDEP